MALLPGNTIAANIGESQIQYTATIYIGDSKKCYFAIKVCQPYDEWLCFTEALNIRLYRVHRTTNSDESFR